VKALALADVGNASKPHALIREDNAVAYDPDAGWKKGDVLPGRLLSRADASGSAADNADVRGEWADGQWTVLWTRKLDTGHADDDKALKPGGVVNVGLAVHDDNVTTRFHHVSFPLTLGIGTKATISSVALK
ncbi:MAG TPA: ethylbenzene dehydrogenase-related protein, partial [Thauera aminoaromatica]|nr:ethylbenzene dehydrogenase-related protein [Thauera aminoaromatica]